MAAVSAAVNQARLRDSWWLGNLPIPVSFPVRMAVLDPCVHPVGGVDVGGLAAPAGGAFGQVGDPQGVAPAVFGLEQGQLGAGVGALAAGEDPHGGGPAGELVTGPAAAQQSRSAR